MMPAVLERRKSSAGAAGEDDAIAAAMAEFEVEEEQVAKGVELIYSDQLNEAEEYFETLRAGHARFSLHYAEVAAVVAFMSCDQDDIARALALLTEAEVLAGQQAQKWKSHSNLKKVNEAVTNIKKWAIGNTKKIGQAIGASAVAQAVGQAVGGSAPLPATFSGAAGVEEEDGDGDDGGEEVVQNQSKEEVKWIHRSRRARLWALEMQAECYLVNSLLQIAGSGESWTAMMKLGYSLQRTWSLYKHCQSKLRQIYKQWSQMEGTFGTVKGKDGGKVAAFLDHSVSLPMSLARPAAPPSSYEESSKALKWNQKVTPEPAVSLPEQSSEMELVDGVREDRELSCLRTGVEFGAGAFNLVVSLIPSTYQKAVEVMGAPADRARGLALLHKVAQSGHARAPLASLLLLHYHTVIMGLFPYSAEHSQGAGTALAALPPSMRKGAFFKVMESRLCCYEGAIRKSLDVMGSVSLEGLTGNNRRVKHLLLDELAWCCVLHADFPRAADCFGKLFQDTVWFKPFYAFLQAACLWQAGESHHDQAASLLRDIPMLASAKKIPLEPLEQYGVNVATAFVASNQAPLFPALELAAFYNGFQHMEKPALERHRQNLEDCLKSSRLGKRGSDFVQEFKLNATDEVVGVVSAPGSASAPAASAAAATNSHYAHKWSKGSKLSCTYLLALCQLNLGEKQAAVDNLRYVVAATEVVPGNVVPYSCYELGSLMLQADAKSEEGFELLDRVSSYPPHEFQSRLKFIVTETIKMYGGIAPPDPAVDSDMDAATPSRQAPEKKKSNIFSKAVNLGNLNLGNFGNNLSNMNPFGRKSGEGSS